MVSSEMKDHDIHTFFCGSIRISKDFLVNFPNHVKTWLSSSVNMYENFPSWLNSGKILYWLTMTVVAFRHRVSETLDQFLSTPIFYDNPTNTNTTPTPTHHHKHTTALC